MCFNIVAPWCQEAEVATTALKRFFFNRFSLCRLQRTTFHFMEMQQRVCDDFLEMMNIHSFISRLFWFLIVCPHPRTTWPCCWRSTTERGYTWSPMRWRGAWTTRSPCRTSTAAWSRSTWSTGWRRASSAASLPSRLVVPRRSSVSSSLLSPLPQLLMMGQVRIKWFWTVKESLYFLLIPTLSCVLCDLDRLCPCLSGEGEHRQVHHRPEGSGQEHQGSGHSVRRLQPVNDCSWTRRC